MKFKFLSIAGVVLAAMAGQVQAAFITTALSSPATTITFSEFGVTNGSIVTNQYSSLGATFGSLSASAGLYQTAAGFSGSGLQNYFPDTYNPFAIKFSTARTGAAFRMITNGSTDIFAAYLNGTLVETANYHTAGSWQSYGFTGIVFDEIRVNIGGVIAASGGNHMRLDNLQMAAAAPVPEPASVAMWGLGVIGLMFARRKRQQKKLTA